MNDFDEEKLERLADKPLTPLEKVLEEKERRARWKRYQDEVIEARFDWFLRKEMGVYYNYDPRDEE